MLATRPSRDLQACLQRVAKIRHCNRLRNPSVPAGTYSLPLRRCLRQRSISKVVLRTLNALEAEGVVVASDWHSGCSGCS